RYRFAGFLISPSLRNLGHRAVQIFRDKTELIARVNIRPHLSVTRGESFGERGQFVHRPEKSGAESPGQHDAHAQGDYAGKDEPAAFGHGRAVRLPPRAVGEAQHSKQCQAVEDRQHPDGATESRFHYLPPKLFPELFKYSDPDTLPTAGADRSPAPTGRRDEACRCSEARSPAPVPINLPRRSPNKSRQ